MTRGACFYTRDYRERSLALGVLADHFALVSAHVAPELLTVSLAANSSDLVDLPNTAERLARRVLRPLLHDGGTHLRADRSAPAVGLAIRGITSQKKTKDRTTTFLRQGASSGAVGSMQAVWKDHRETEPSVTES